MSEMVGSLPRLRAEFKLGADGRPDFVEAGDLRHYRLRLMVEGAPEDTYAVTYQLDPSYYETVRETRNRETDYAEELTSFGDYAVQARVRTRSGRSHLAAPLSRLLEETYSAASQRTGAIEEAIDYIRRH